MDRISVDSSNIKSVGYEEETKTLEIEFNGGGVYQYEDVPPNIYSGLVNADSVGSYFHFNIKKGPYRYTKIS